MNDTGSGTSQPHRSKFRECDLTYEAVLSLRRAGIRVCRIAKDLHSVGGVPLSTELLFSVARQLKIESARAG